MTLLFTFTQNQIEVIGYVGSFISSITLVPQVWQSWKTKSVGDLNFWMISIVIVSTLIWLVYGFGIANGGPVIVTNSVVLALSLLLMYFKFSFKKDK